MPLGMFRLGIFAWGNRRGIGRLVVLGVISGMALPVMLALLVVAAAAPPGAPAAGGRRPMPSWVVTQPFGCTGVGLEPARGSCAHFHFGIDLAAPAGTPVSAVTEGQAEVILPAGFGGGYGLHVLVHGGAGVDTLYGHLWDVAVTNGEVVAVGTLLGHEGSTGLSTGPHLHFEVRQRGVAVDPVSVFPGIFGPEGQPR